MEEIVYLTPSHLPEYIYCPRFTYFEYVLGIAQHEEKRFKVIKGREIHQKRKRFNVKYLRKKLGVIDKESDIELNCPRHNIRGKVDELLYLEDGSIAPLDYKYAQYKNRIWKGHKVQQILYAVMMESIYLKKVHKSFICYTRSQSKIISIDILDKEKTKAIENVKECLEIIQEGTYPKGTPNTKRCADCTYRNICIK